MVCPSCTHRELSASFAASAVKTQAKVAHYFGREWRPKGRVGESLVYSDTAAHILTVTQSNEIVVRYGQGGCARISSDARGGAGEG